MQNYTFFLILNQIVYIFILKSDIERISCMGISTFFPPKFTTNVFNIFIFNAACLHIYRINFDK